MQRRRALPPPPPPPAPIAGPQSAASRIGTRPRPVRDHMGVTRDIAAVTAVRPRPVPHRRAYERLAGVILGPRAAGQHDRRVDGVAQGPVQPVQYALPVAVAVGRIVRQHRDPQVGHFYGHAQIAVGLTQYMDRKAVAFRRRPALYVRCRRKGIWRGAIRLPVRRIGRGRGPPAVRRPREEIRQYRRECHRRNHGARHQQNRLVHRKSGAASHKALASGSCLYRNRPCRRQPAATSHKARASDSGGGRPLPRPDGCMVVHGRQPARQGGPCSKSGRTKWCPRARIICHLCGRRESADPGSELAVAVPARRPAAEHHQIVAPEPRVALRRDAARGKAPLDGPRLAPAPQAKRRPRRRPRKGAFGWTSSSPPRIACAGPAAAGASSARGRGTGRLAGAATLGSALWRRRHPRPRFGVAALRHVN